jgi:hypothetical protein
LLNFSPAGNVWTAFSASAIEPVTGGAPGCENLFPRGCTVAAGSLAGLLGMRSKGNARLARQRQQQQ